MSRLTQGGSGHIAREPDHRSELTISLVVPVTGLQHLLGHLAARQDSCFVNVTGWKVGVLETDLQHIVVVQARQLGNRTLEHSVYWSIFGIWPHCAGHSMAETRLH